MNATRVFNSLLAGGVSLIAISLAAPSAFAADTGPSVIEELVVTAQKKAEAIQDVPIAVSAFNGDSLAKSKIDGGPNLVLAVPNVNFSKGNFTGYNFQIRGIGSKLVAASGDAGTGIHLNNVPLIANNLFETEFFDVERVEVLRGPQGTLYGRNATGGVVNIITNRPVDHFAANLKVGYGNFGETKIRGMINVPISDTIAFRLAGTTLKRGGYGKNTYTGNDADDRDLYGARAGVSFAPTDNFKAVLTFDKFHEDDHRSRIGKQYCTKDPGPANVGGVGYSTAAGGLIGQVERGLFSQGCASTSLYSSGVLGTVNTQATLGGLFGALGGFQTGDAYAGKMQSSNVRDIESTFDPIYRSNTETTILDLSWQITDKLKLTSITSGTRYNLYTRQDYNRYTPSVAFNSVPNPVNVFAAVPGYATAIYSSLFPGGVVKDPQNGPFNRFTTSDISAAQTKEFTQEFRLQSDFDGPFNFNIGGLYLDYKATGDYYVMFNTGTAYYQVNNALLAGNANCTTGSTCVAIDPKQNPDRSGHNYYDNYGPYNLKSTGLFGEAYWKASDTLKWTLGLRLNKDEKQVESHAVALGATGSGILGPPTGAAAIQSVKFNETTGRFGFDWKPETAFTSQTLVYGFYSRGYKAGGMNPACSPTVGTCPKATFEPEFVNAFEIGAKNTLLDGRMILNMTGFAYDYTGYQVSKIVNRTSINENIDAKIKGLELESIWSPIERLRFNASLGYLNTEITNGSSIDTFNRTQGDPNLIVVKSSSASNCVTTKAVAAAALAYANSSNNPFALLGVCSNAFGPSNDGVAVSLKGKELPNSPHYTFTLGGQYTFDVGHGWNAVARADYYRQSKTYARIYNSAADQIDSWQNVNLTLTVSNEAKGWTVDAFVKNATDETAITDTYLTDDSSGLFRNAFFTEPRTYGIAISKQW
ncbi:MAG: TonB-dependent receptor [Phenylobacterium zucineum]|nr:MAG: TonB-dependent receptor [Phenylobacterium zucineum]